MLITVTESWILESAFLHETTNPRAIRAIFPGNLCFQPPYAHSVTDAYCDITKSLKLSAIVYDFISNACVGRPSSHRADEAELAQLSDKEAHCGGLAVYRPVLTMTWAVLIYHPYHIPLYMLCLCYMASQHVSNVHCFRYLHGLTDWHCQARQVYSVRQ